MPPPPLLSCLRYPSLNFLLHILDGLATYLIKIKAVNNVGIGNFSVPVLVKTQQKTIDRTPPDDGPNKGAIAGGAIGAIAFIIILVIVLLFVQRKIQKGKREKSVMVKCDSCSSIITVFHCIEAEQIIVIYQWRKDQLLIDTKDRGK